MKAKDSISLLSYLFESQCFDSTSFQQYTKEFKAMICICNLSLNLALKSQGKQCKALYFMVRRKHFSSLVCVVIAYHFIVYT